MADPSVTTEKHLFETLSATRSELKIALTDRSKPAVETVGRAVIQLESLDQPFARQQVTTSTTTLPAHPFIPIAGTTPSTPANPLPAPPDVPPALDTAVVTGVLNGVAASWTAYGSGIPTAL